jgi:hypothetical protein
MTDPYLPPGMSPTGAPRPTGEASASPETSTAAVKRRQLLLLAAIASTIASAVPPVEGILPSPKSGRYKMSIDLSGIHDNR